jgi:hypothetical protein
VRQLWYELTDRYVLRAGFIIASFAGSPGGIVKDLHSELANNGPWCGLAPSAGTLVAAAVIALEQKRRDRELEMAANSVRAEAGLPDNSRVHVRKAHLTP